jgi:acyl-CoA dehydrogenase
MAMDYARQRVTFGQPLSERQAIQFMIADSAIDIHAARLMVYRTAWLYDQGQDTRDDSYMTKIFCTEMASRVVDRAIQIHGGVGLTMELPLQYWFRQVRSIRITEGVTEVLRWRMARNMIRARG